MLARAGNKITVVRSPQFYVRAVTDMSPRPTPVSLFIRLLFCAQLMRVAAYFPGGPPSCRRWKYPVVHLVHQGQYYAHHPVCGGDGGPGLGAGLCYSHDVLGVFVCYGIDLNMPGVDGWILCTVFRC